MKSRNIYLKIMLMAAACLFAAGLHAQEEGMEEEEMAVEEEGMLEEEAEELPPLYTSEIEFGVEYSSQDSFKFGEYSGREEEGFYGIGNLLIRKNSFIGDDDNDYWILSGSNLGLDSRNLYGEYSHDGTYGQYSKGSAYSFFFEYDQLPHYRLDDAETPFVGAGTANQFLPTPWAGGSSPAAMQPDLDANLRQVDVETERQKLGGGFSWIPTDGWAITAEYHHEDKDGTETLGGMPAGQFLSSILITPVNFDTDEFDVKVAYAGEKGQFELGYHLSIFDNNDGALRWENPFTSGGLGAQQQMGLAPDNDAQVITFAGGYNLGQTTRITGNFSYSLMEQDDTFLPYTVNPTTAITVPLPRSNLDGEVEKWFVNLAIATRPLPKLNLTGRYTFDYKDNNTPIDTYLYVSRDGTSQSAIDESRARINRPYGYEKHKVQLDANYRLMPRARLAVGYQYENIDRNVRDRRVVLTGSTFNVGMNEVDTTEEHTGYIKLMGTPTDRTQGWIKYLHAERDGDDYFTPNPFTFGHSDAFLDTVAFPDFENHFLSRKFYMADRDRDQVSGNLNFFPNNKFTASFVGSYTTDDYDESILGRTDRDNLAVTLDLSYIPAENITTYAYFTHERIDNEQAGCQSCSTSPPADISNFYTVDTEDRVNTVGLGLEWNAIKDKIDVALDYSFSKGTTEIDPAGGTSPATVVPFPDLETTIHSLNLRADYRVNRQTSVRLGYLYEYFSTDDFALDGVQEDTIDRILSLGNSSPDYNVHVIGLSLNYKF